MPAGDVTVTATFVASEYDIIVINPAEGGSISIDQSSANAGDIVYVNVDEVEDGYVLDKIIVNDGAVEVHHNGDDYYFEMPMGDVTVTAEFTKVAYNIYAESEGNGTISVDSTAKAGDTVEVTVNEVEGYYLEQLTYKGDDGETHYITKDAEGKYTFTMPASDVTVTAVFAANEYSIYTVVNPTEAGTINVVSPAATGDTVSFTIEAAEGFDPASANVSVSGVTDLHFDGTTYTFTMPASDVTITASWDEMMYNVVADAVGNGSVSVDPTSAHAGSEITVTTSTEDGYGCDVTAEDANGNPVTVTQTGDNTYTFNMPAADVTVTATFTANEYSVSVDPIPENGTITGYPETATVGDTVSFTVTPATGYELVEGSVTVNGSAEGVHFDGTHYTFEMPAEAVTITAEFKAIEYNIFADAGKGGTIEGLDSSAAYGTPVSFTVTPEDSYEVGTVSILINGAYTPLTPDASGTYTFEMPATDVTIVATFTANSYDVSAVQTTGGTIAGYPTSATVGESVSFTVTPETGYELVEGSVTVNGGAVTVHFDGTNYMFEMPAGAAEITAAFELATYNIFAEAYPHGTVEVSTTTANYNDTITVTVHPADGYVSDGITITDAGGGQVGYTKVDDVTYTFTMPPSDVTVAATFTIDSFTVTPIQAANGTILVSPTTASSGTVITVTVTPDEGYECTGITIDGAEVEAHRNGDEWTFIMPAADIEVTPTFEIASYEMAVDENAEKGTLGVEIDGVEVTDNPVDVKCGSEVTLTPQPNEGEELEGIVIRDASGKDVSDQVDLTKNDDGTYTFTMPAYPVSVTPDWGENFHIAVEDGTTGHHGTINVPDEATYHSDVTISVDANEGFKVVSFSIFHAVTGEDVTADCDLVQNADGTWTFTMPGEDVVIVATWVTAYNVNVTATPEAGGEVAVSVSGISTTAAAEGESVVVTVIDNDGYAVSSFTVDGAEVALVDNTYTFDMPAADVAISVTWKAQLTEAMFTVDTSDENYTGSAIEKLITSNLTEGVDYTVAYDNNVNAGTATITITGMGDYAGELTYEFQILPGDISTATVDGIDSNYTWTGDPIDPDNFTVTVDGRELTPGVDYTVEYGENTEVGTGTVTITGIAPNYVGEQTIEFTIDPVEIQGAWFEVDTSDESYTGSEIFKTITSNLTEGVDYTVTYEDNVYRGVAHIAIEGIGGYSGTVDYYFNILRTYTRLAGDDRYGTMEAEEDEGFASADSVVLTAGSNFPDALSSAGFAGTLEAPIVLTATDSLSAEASEEITRLGAHNVYIVGGENSVSPTVVSQLEAMGLNVVRIAGSDRYETALETYYYGEGSWGTSGNGTAKTAIIASGETFPDSLSASSYAWWSTSPIFLSTSTGIDDRVKAAITDGGFDRILIVGGPNSVPFSVEDWANTVTSTVRMSGADRYATSVTFADWAHNEGMTFNDVGIATGKSFPDALAGGALCGVRGSVLMLADIDVMDGTAAVDELAKHEDEISRVYYLGGPNSVTPELTALIEGTLGY